MTSANTLLAELELIGRDPSTGGYHRPAWGAATLELREWFAGAAAARGLELSEDGNGNQFARWGSGPGALLIGSHLDSVPGGGPLDGPLGVTSAFAALDSLRADGFVPARPVVVANFSDEEGARFGVACLGSRLATGAITPASALALRDDTGTTLAEAMTQAGRDPRAAGPAAWLAEVSEFVELHVEQGRSLIHQDAAVGVASAIWPHGRWRLEVCGQGNHAGATLMADRHDPMLTYAATVLAARRMAIESGQRATFGKLAVHPGGTNSIPSRVDAWLDARAESEAELERLVAAILNQARRAADLDGTTVSLQPESITAGVTFDPGLRHRLATRLGAPVLPTGAGHDAGILSARMPTAMLFVRNPTGVSHAPSESAEPDDIDAGVAALALAIRELA